MDDLSLYEIWTWLINAPVWQSVPFFFSVTCFAIAFFAWLVSKPEDW